MLRGRLAPNLKLAWWLCGRHPGDGHPAVQHLGCPESVLLPLADALHPNAFGSLRYDWAPIEQNYLEKSERPPLADLAP